MSGLCKVFGHKRNAGWWGDGLYGVLRGPTTDGTGREHYTVTLECDRCGERYLAARFHGPLAATPTPPTLSEDLREALEQAQALIQEAKGLAGDGAVTDHLDFADHWLGKIDETITAASTPAIPSAGLREVMARLPAAPWRVTRSLLDGFGASLEVDNGSNFGNIGHIRDYDTACALADLAREVAALAQVKAS